MSISSFIIFCIRFLVVTFVIFGHNEKKHEQGEGKEDVERPVFERGRAGLRIECNPK